MAKETIEVIEIAFISGLTSLFIIAINSDLSIFDILFDVDNLVFKILLPAFSIASLVAFFHWLIFIRFLKR